MRMMSSSRMEARWDSGDFDSSRLREKPLMAETTALAMTSGSLVRGSRAVAKSATMARRERWLAALAMAAPSMSELTA